MTEKRADELKKGDVLLLKGERWTVLKAKVKGKWVRLEIDGRRGSFTDEVKARTVYDVVAPAKAGERAGANRSSTGHGSAQGRGPLLSPAGAQNRWATADESATTAWDEPASKAEAKLIDRLGARLVGVEVDGGRLVVPPVDDATILGHLLTMHERTWAGVTFAEAKAWVKEHDPATEQPVTQVIDALSLQRAFDLHDSLHVDLTSIPKPHWHQERAPR